MEKIPQATPQVPEIPEETDREIFQQYVEHLQLRPEDFKKKILDVGSGSAQFAKWAREHGVSDQIYSIDVNPSLSDLASKSNAVVGNVEHLPFANETFDLVISAYAIPQTFMDVSLTPEQTTERIRRGLSEMLRVARDEVRFGRIGYRVHEVHAKFYDYLQEVLKEIQAAGVSVVQIPSGYFSVEPGESPQEAFTVSLKKKTSTVI